MATMRLAIAMPEVAPGDNPPSDPEGELLLLLVVGDGPFPGVVITAVVSEVLDRNVEGGHVVDILG